MTKKSKNFHPKIVILINYSKNFFLIVFIFADKNPRQADYTVPRKWWGKFILHYLDINIIFYIKTYLMRWLNPDETVFGIFLHDNGIFTNATINKMYVCPYQALIFLYKSIENIFCIIIFMCVGTLIWVCLHCLC